MNLKCIVPKNRWVNLAFIKPLSKVETSIMGNDLNAQVIFTLFDVIKMHICTSCRQINRFYFRIETNMINQSCTFVQPRHQIGALAKVAVQDSKIL